jgi:hypothetical protein
MNLPGETEAGNGGRNHARGIARWAHRDDERARGYILAPPNPHRIERPHALKNPRAKGGILSNGEHLSPFQAELTQRRNPMSIRHTRL